MKSQTPTTRSSGKKTHRTISFNTMTVPATAFGCLAPKPGRMLSYPDGEHIESYERMVGGDAHTTTPVPPFSTSTYCNVSSRA